MLLSYLQFFNYYSIQNTSKIFMVSKSRKRNKEKIMIEPIALLVCDRFMHTLAAGYLNMAQTYIWIFIYSENQINNNPKTSLF